MKKIIAVIITLVLCLTGAFSLTACGIKPMREEIKVEWEDLPENTNPNLKYFGYFHTDGFGTQGDYYEEIDALENTNVYLINSHLSIPEIKAGLERARSLGKKAWVFCRWPWEWGAGLWMEGYNFDITPERLQSLRIEFRNEMAELREYIDDGTMIGLEFDEPMWHGTTQNSFYEITKLIREEEPSLRIMHCMTVYDLGHATFVRESDGAVYPKITREINQYVTDVMYDYYGDWNESQRKTLMEQLKAVSPKDARIWGCATGFVNESDTKLANGKLDTYELKRAMVEFYKEAINEPRCVGIMSFTFLTSEGSDKTYMNSIGASGFVDPSNFYYDLSVKKLHINIGRRIIGEEELDLSEKLELGIAPYKKKYTVGEEIKMPIITATDGTGKELSYVVKMFTPSGNQIAYKDFVVDVVGTYVIELKAIFNGQTIVKTASIQVS